MYVTRKYISSLQRGYNYAFSISYGNNLESHINSQQPIE